MSTELAVIEPAEIDFFTEESSIGSDIEALLDSISKHELKLSVSYIRLGMLLLRAQKTRYFNGYPSLAQYFGYIGERIGRARSQIYAYLSAAERLLPYISESDLEKMGISRAQELVRYVKQSGLGVPDHLLVAALDPDVKLDKLHINVSEALHLKGEVKGTWYEPILGFYVEPGEKAEIQAAIDLARNSDPSIASLPDHQQRKEIMLMFAREFMSSNPTE